jgi:hypothetical protein
MSAHAYAPPVTARERDRQPRLFALPGGAAAESLPAPATVAAAAAVLAPAPSPFAPARTLVPVPDVGEPTRGPLPGPEPARSRSRSLDAELRLAWTAITAGAPAACLMCGGRMEPLAAPATGGACTSCGTTLE